MLLGTCKDGRLLSYDASLYEFALASTVVTLSDVRALDDRALIHWRANELRDWFSRVDEADLAACHERALNERNAASYDELSAEQRVLADAARDDSILAGKIVDADPALVHAVANQLIEEGLLAPSSQVRSAEGADVNPLAVMDLPRGMEPLSQLERAKGPNRKMTRSEARLMCKILKNDDKAKEKRERHEAPTAQEHAQE